MDVRAEPFKAFVGRGPELARLRELLDQALQGRGAVCFVTGEPGAGKSTLLNEFCARLHEELPEVLFAAGDCNPQTGTGDPYLPFREIMAMLTDSDEGPDADPEQPAKRRRLLQATARILAEHGPDLVDIFVPGGAIITRVGAQAAGRIRERRHAGSGPAPGSPGIEQQHLFEQYTNVLLELSRRQPLVLLVDDLHWADEASIQLLFHLCRRLASERVLLLGAYRANEIAAGRDGGRHPLEPVLNEVKRYFGDVQVDIQQSQDADGRAFVDHFLDVEPNAFSPEFREALFQRTGGHALFTVELVQYLKERGDLLRDEQGEWIAADAFTWEGLPARVEGVIHERIARLAPEEAELLEAASILGESFSAEALAALTEQNARETVRSLSGSLAKSHGLVRALGIERISGIRQSNYEFRHNLIHRYFYESMDPVERGFLHEAAGEALEGLFGADPAPVAVQLARHFAEAQLDDKAAGYFLLAGQEALRSHANSEARAHLARALELLASPGPGDSQGLDLAREAATAMGHVLVLDGEFGAAREQFRQARRMAGAAADPLAGVRALQGIATTFEREHRHPDALDTLAEAAALLAGSTGLDEAEAAHESLNIQVARLWLYYWTGNTDGMAAAIEAAEPELERHGTPTQRRRFYTGKAGLGNRRDRFAPSAQTLAAAELALRAASESDLVLDQADGQFGTGFAHMLAGRFESAHDLIASALEGASRCGDRTLQARCLTYLVVLQRLTGQPDEVRSRLTGAHQACEAVGMQEYIAVLDACGSWLAWKVGEAAEARRLALRALEGWQAQAPRYPFKWLALLQLVDIELAEEDGLEGALEHARVLVEPANSRLQAGVEEALQEAIGAPDPAEAGACLAGALRAARQFGYL